MCCEFTEQEKQQEEASVMEGEGPGAVQPTGAATHVSTGSSIEEAASSQENIHATDPHHGDVHGGGEGMSDNLSALTCNWAIRS